MYRDDMEAANYYPVLCHFSEPSPRPKAFKLRCPAPKTGKVPAGVRLVKWEDTPFPRNVTPEMRSTVEDLDRLGIPWTLYHANVRTRIPFRSRRYYSNLGCQPEMSKHLRRVLEAKGVNLNTLTDNMEDHPYQLEAVYVPSLRRIAVVWYPWAGVEWLDTRGDIDRDLAVWSLDFSQTLTD